MSKFRDLLEHRNILGLVFLRLNTPSLALCCCQVLGSDLCLPAIEDARRNAEANGIKNCEFVCGKVREAFCLLEASPLEQPSSHDVLVQSDELLPRFLSRV